MGVSRCPRRYPAWSSSLSPLPNCARQGGQDLQDATNGIVSRSYITNLRKDRIENPGYEKMAAIAKAMGFPPGLWFEDVGPGFQLDAVKKRQSLSGRLDQLLTTLTNDRTGSPYTDAELARMSLGVLTEEEVAGMRAGTISNPTIDKVVELAGVFGVEAAYFLDGAGEPPVLDREALDVLRDETTSAIARKSFRLPAPEKRMILNIIDELEKARRGGDQEATKNSGSRAPG
jgi:transcriptional regulator with XRE-family HTH domain